jgi:probable phosphoglycerate mutase
MPDPAGPRRVILVRHGATEWSASGRHTGRTDIPLTPEGREQALDAIPALHAVLTEADPVVFTSPLRRAVDTAALMLPQFTAETSDALAEVDYGSLEGLSGAEIEQRQPDWSVFRHGCPDGEGVAQIVARCDSFIFKMERVAAGRTVVAFTHGHLGRALAVRLMGLEIATADHLHNDTASIGIIDAKRGHFVLGGWNLR